MIKSLVDDADETFDDIGVGIVLAGVMWSTFSRPWLSLGHGQRARLTRVGHGGHDTPVVGHVSLGV